MLELLKQWLRNLGVVVHHHQHGGVNRFYKDSETIHIHHADDEQQQLFMLLHEAGHYLLSRTPVLHRALYPFKYHDDPHVKDWIDDVLREEYDAWVEGWHLSELLGFEIDQEAFEKYADNCLNSYRKMACDLSMLMEGFLTTKDDSIQNIFDQYIEAYNER